MTLDMGGRHIQVALFCLGVLIAPAVTNAATGGDAQRRLQLSDTAAQSFRPSGVYGDYAKVRIGLAQARAFALLADVENTTSRLPYADDPRPDWASGGDGMVRQLLVSLDLDTIHKTLLMSLATSGREAQAFGYVKTLTAAQGHDGLYLDLGIALGIAGTLRPVELSTLTTDQQADLVVGMAHALIEAGDDKKAKRMLEGIDPSKLAEAITALARALILDNNSAAISRLLRVADLDTAASAGLIREAVTYSVRAGDLDAAAQLISRSRDPTTTNALYAQLALGFVAQGDLKRAGEIFDSAPAHDDTMWEHVAMQTDRHAWLEAYYLDNPDPWRRSERLYQFALRRLAAGDRREANRLAGLAARSAAQIAGDSTRWLAYRELAHYYALAGDPQSATHMAAKIPTGEPERQRANEQVIVAWVRNGGVDEAQALADQITDPVHKAQAFSAAAGASGLQKPAAYQRLVDASRAACQAIPATRVREQSAAWVGLTTMQLRIGDTGGARKTAAQAPTDSARANAFEAIVDDRIKAGDTAGALDAAHAIPPGMDPQVGHDRQQHALGEVVDAVAASGDGLAAMKLLAEITQDTVREFHTAMVARALLTQGESSQVTALALALKRSDTRQDTLSLIFFMLAQKGELPERTLMDHVPERRGGELCWAVAAASDVDTQTLDTWLNELTDSACRAFAYAGAAYALLAPPADTSAETVFALVDPTRTEERMAKAMQQYAFRTR